MADLFVLDANVFIEAAQRYYAFDLVPKFWESITEHAANGRVQSIDRVKQELDRGKDTLKEWASEHFNNAFASTDEPAIITSFAQVVTWVQTQNKSSVQPKPSLPTVQMVGWSVMRW